MLSDTQRKAFVAVARTGRMAVCAQPSLDKEDWTARRWRVQSPLEHLQDRVRSNTGRCEHRRAGRVVSTGAARTVDPDAPVDPELTAQLRASGTWVGLLGLEFISASPALVRARLAWNAEMCTLRDALAGGALVSLADVTAAWCAHLNLPPGAAGTTTIELKVNYFRPVVSGRVHSAARPIHAGRRTMVVETELYGDARKLVAKVT
jgi:1,4-dihydroxy-2-naphthoyl-CoA hydrolase